MCGSFVIIFDLNKFFKHLGLLIIVTNKINKICDTFEACEFNDSFFICKGFVSFKISNEFFFLQNRFSKNNINNLYWYLGVHWSQIDWKFHYLRRQLYHRRLVHRFT